MYLFWVFRHCGLFTKDNRFRCGKKGQLTRESSLIKHNTQPNNHNHALLQTCHKLDTSPAHLRHS